MTAEEMLRNHVKYRKRRKLLKKLIPVIVLILVVIIHITYVSFSHKLKYINYNHEWIIYDSEFYVPERKEECKKLIKKYYKTYHFYVEKELDAVTAGKALYFPPIVFIDKDLSGVNYIITYVHELMHIKYQTGNERFVTFKTFTTLYESKNETLRGCAMELAYMVISGAYEREYDCGYYILEYLKGVEIE